MNFDIKNSIVLIITCLFFIFSNLVVAQNESKSGAGEVSEIIIPTSANIRNNFNLFYEIHLSREAIPTPSFWYKIIFSKDCSFEFTLIPVSEDDKYDFYFFKIESNYDFCEAVKEEKIISCNASRVHKVYKDREQSEKFRSGLVDVKPIPVKAGDAIYLEVFSTKGNDCGHILDFRTTENSFVVKVINDNCSGNKNTDSTIVGQYKPMVTDEKQAMEIFGNTLCPQNKKALFVSSIQVNDKNVRVQKKLDFANYSKSEAPKYVKPKQDELKKLLPTISTLNNTKPDSLKENTIENKNPSSDSIKKMNLVVRPNDVLVVDTQKVNMFIKSTADLNSVIENACPINHEVKIIKSDHEKNSTRLEVDNVLFSLLREDLKRKTESISEQLTDYNKALKKGQSPEKKEEYTTSIKEIKQQKTELQTQLKDTDKKLKLINKLLHEERNKKTKTEESVFTKCTDPEGDQKKILRESPKDSSEKISELPVGVVYKVQIGVYKNPVTTDMFKGLTPVFEEVFSGGVKYSAGSFSHFSDARLAKDYIINMGLKDAFVIAYFKGKRVSIEDARANENK